MDGITHSARSAGLRELGRGQHQRIGNPASINATLVESGRGHIFEMEAEVKRLVMHQLLAIGLHILRAEFAMAGQTDRLLHALSLFVLWGGRS
jgi:hypothetical protein